MTRFLHTADWQIGRQYSRFAEEDAAILTDARFTVVERLARLAADEQVDAVLVAGDIFDAQTISDRTLRRTFRAMQDFAGPWLMLPGNHDAALAESVWTRAKRLGAVPENVQLLITPKPCEFAEAGFVVLPAPLTQRQTFDDLTAWFDAAETPDDLLRIGIAHGSVEGQLTTEVDATNPIAADRAATARLDYLALGDWHGCKRIDARTWYSGTPEQERFKDNGAGQALIVDIEKPGAEPTITQHTTGQYPWHKLHYHLTVASDLQQLAQRLAELPDHSVVDLTVTGRIDLAAHRQLKCELGIAAARHRSFQSHLGSLQLQPTDEDIANLQADGYVRAVINELRDRQGEHASDEDRATASQALAILAGMLHDRQQDGNNGGQHP